ncbi:MAG: hypothetical protein M3P01_10485 [Actinomycetota bacterium]|nr:hypothetical protein [Actinomycetota bacterium]
MTTLFLVVLVLAWIALIIPAAWRARQTAPFSATERFRKRLDLMAPRATSQGRWIVVPQSRDRLERASFRRGQRRRRRILIALIAGVIASAIAAPIVEGAVWEVQICLDVSLALYVVLLVVAKQRRAEVVKKLRTMKPAAKARRTPVPPRFIGTIRKNRVSWSRCTPGAAATDASDPAALVVFGDGTRTGPEVDPGRA